jgi:hypothetical protein
MEQDTKLILRISAKTKRDFVEALGVLNKTISGSIREHIKRQINKADKLKLKQNYEN